MQKKKKKEIENTVLKRMNDRQTQQFMEKIRMNLFCEDG